MADDAKTPLGLHLAGLVLAAVLAVVSYGLYTVMPGLLRNTFLRGFGGPVTCLAIIVMLSIAEKVWVWLQRRFGP